MSRWSVEMLALQCAQRFPARPADPDSSVFAEFFPFLRFHHHNLTYLRRNISRFTSTGTLLVFCRNFLSKSLWLVSRQTFDRLFSTGVSERSSPRYLPTLTVARFVPVGCTSILWVIMSSLPRKHTGSIRGHNHLMDVVESLSRDSKIGPVRVNHKVSTTGDGTRKQGDVEISNFPISLRDGAIASFPKTPFFPTNEKGNAQGFHWIRAWLAGA